MHTYVYPTGPQRIAAKFGAALKLNGAPLGGVLMNVARIQVPGEAILLFLFALTVGT